MKMSYVLHDARDAAQGGSAAASPARALALAALLGAVPMVALIVLMAGAEAAPVLAGLGTLGLGSALACRSLRRDAPHDRLGLANLVTLGRLGLVGGLAGSLAAGAALPWTVAGLAALALSLDGVDGWIARRQRMSSRFDMEVDCALALVLALHAAQGPGFDAEVLLLGVPRYAFGLAALALPWLRRGLPDRLSRKMVCVLQMGALIALQLPPLPDRAGEVLIAAALVALALSFGRDILWLHRRRP